MQNYHCSGQFLKNFAYVNEALIGVYTVEQIVPSPAVVIFNYSIFFLLKCHRLTIRCLYVYEPLCHPYFPCITLVM